MDVPAGDNTTSTWSSRNRHSDLLGMHARLNVAAPWPGRQSAHPSQEELAGSVTMARTDDERERLAATFDSASDLYQQARPEYPGVLYDRLVEATGLGPGAQLLEVGCATGKATLPLARRGFVITCLEPGPALAAAARTNLSGFEVRVVQERFERWPPDRPYDLVLATTAWHWVDPKVRYHKAAAALRPQGWLAFWEAVHVFPDDGDPFFGELQPVNEQIGEGLPPGTTSPRPGELPELGDEVVASGLFEMVDVVQYDWETRYDAEGYINLLNTFSGHIAMAGWQRDRLYGEVRRRLSERSDSTLRRHWGAVLHIARRAP